MSRAPENIIRLAEEGKLAVAGPFRDLSVRSIWMEEKLSRTTKFITLIPAK